MLSAKSLFAFVLLFGLLVSVNAGPIGSANVPRSAIFNGVSDAVTDVPVPACDQYCYVMQRVAQCCGEYGYSPNHASCNNGAASCRR